MLCIPTVAPVYFVASVHSSPSRVHYLRVLLGDAAYGPVHAQRDAYGRTKRQRRQPPVVTRSGSRLPPRATRPTSRTCCVSCSLCRAGGPTAWSIAHRGRDWVGSRGVGVGLGGVLGLGGCIAAHGEEEGSGSMHGGRQMTTTSTGLAFCVANEGNTSVGAR